MDYCQEVFHECQIALKIFYFHIAMEVQLLELAKKNVLVRRLYLPVLSVILKKWTRKRICRV